MVSEPYSTPVTSARLPLAARPLMTFESEPSSSIWHCRTPKLLRLTSTAPIELRFVLIEPRFDSYKAWVGSILLGLVWFVSICVRSVLICSDCNYVWFVFDLFLFVLTWLWWDCDYDLIWLRALSLPMTLLFPWFSLYDYEQFGVAVVRPSI